MATNTMALPKVVSRDEWLAARRKLLDKEKALSRERDTLNAERRRLPMVRIDSDYIFESPAGKARLLDLFDGRRQLIIYHFMFDPTWEEGCPQCSFLVDNIGCLAHLRARDTSLALVSRAPSTKIEPFKKRMGWTLPWYSSFVSLCARCRPAPRHLQLLGSHAARPPGRLGTTAGAQQQPVPGVGPPPRQIRRSDNGF
jgi:predicted dithiol-disulfide oxidoreductase (DUF899 family)